MSDAARDLLRFIDRSPTPYHAVAEAGRRLAVAGFTPLEEASEWELSPGDRRLVVRGDGSLLAFEVGAESPVEAGFRVIGAHTDSPNLRLKPRADAIAHGYRQLAVEPYGSVLLHTWLDRDLSLAGRLTLARPDGTPCSLAIDFERPLLRVPSLAIHLQRELATKGLELNPQQHAVPVAGLEDAPPLAELLVAELQARGQGRFQARDVLAFDLMTCDVQPGSLGGARGEFVLAPRLDNLASCHAAVSALATAGDGPGELPPFTRAIALHDHEEVGSRSFQGAGGNLLASALERCVAGFKGGAPQGPARALARSFLVSVDMAHAVHPNFADRHEPVHRPLIGRGPVLKLNAGQSYASDAMSAGLFTAVCRSVGVEPQHFVTRSDLPCGSTIGPISAARVGIPTVDVGNPMLAMHSCREMAGAADVAPMIEVLRAFLRGAPA